MTKDTNTGYYNTANYNTGYGNTGGYNTGGYNTGGYNTGDYNTGYYNTGSHNTGYGNTGDYNTGYYNTGSHNTGCFNTKAAEKAYYFNRLINTAEWDEADKPDWIYLPRPTTWVHSKNMTKQEKKENPSYTTTGGYLRTNDMKEEWAKAYATASPEDIALTKALPAFDADVFLEITGIDLRDDVSTATTCEGREVEIDGVTYVLKAKEQAQ